MEPKFFMSMTNQIYTSLWNKYRPVILQLMLASSEGPQQYKMYSHEFRALNPKQKSGFAFTLKVFQGKSQNDIKASVPAQDLLAMLGMSRKASELLEIDRYEFTLDKGFILHVIRINEI